MREALQPRRRVMQLCELAAATQITRVNEHVTIGHAQLVVIEMGIGDGDKAHVPKSTRARRTHLG